MNDEFLHRLRKRPRPAFAAQLRAQLRQQSMSPLAPKVPSRVRTLLALLLLGGSAFAITGVAMRGPPPSVVALYRHTTAWITVGRTPPSIQRPGYVGMVEGLRWGGSGSSPAHGNALPGGSANQSAAQMTGGRSAAGSSTAASSGGSSPGGAASGTAVAPIEVVSSWAAYPYAAAFVAQLSHHWMGAPARQIGVSVRDSDAWPGEMCNGGAKAPDIEYAFEQAESGRPCPRGGSGRPSPVVAVPIGYEILVLARSPLYGEVDFTRRQIFLALAKWVPDPSHAGTVHENPSTTWRQIDSTLGQEPIAFVGPPLSSAAGRSMIELLMEAGCNTYPWIAALEWTNPDQYARICRTVRSDGVYVEVSGLAAGTLLVQPNAVGILTTPGAFVLHSHGRLPLDGLAVSKLDGVLPTEQNVLSGDYPGSRRLYLFTRGRVAPNVLTPLEAVQMPYMPYQDSALVPPSRQDLREVYDELP